MIKGIREQFESEIEYFNIELFVTDTLDYPSKR